MNNNSERGALNWAAVSVLRIICAIVAGALAVAALLGSDPVRQVKLLAVMGIVLAVGLVVP